MSIGSRIADRRKQLGWTQQELADRMGYTNKTTITKIESGTNDITQSKIVKFAEVLEVPVSYLMEWDTESPAYQLALEMAKNKPALEEGGGLTEEEQHFLSEFRKLSLGAQDSVNQILHIVNTFPEDQQPVVSSLALTVLKTKGLL